MDVAVLAKPRHLDGRLVVKGTAGLPFVLREGDEVAFVPPQTDLPRRAVVAAVDIMDDHTAEVAFEGVGGEEARGLVGCHCLVRRSGIDESLFEEEPALWTGWQVIDAHAGPVGEISDFVDNGAQALLVVDRADGSQAYVPVVDQIVRAVDVEHGMVHVDLPAGLLDL